MTLNVFAIGTRAQLIKVAPIVLAFEHIGLPCILLMTGQHKETMQDIIGEFSLKSPRCFAVEAEERATIPGLLAWLPKAYEGIRRAFRTLHDSPTERKLNVLVHGDTLTTLLSAHCAMKAGARVIHLESGLTSGSLFDPFPEELVRRAVFRMTDVAVCPDERSAAHMRKVSKAVVFDSRGNSIVDAARFALSRDACQKDERHAPYLLFSIHRFQNIYRSERLKEIVALIAELTEYFEVFFILHPSTKKRLARQGLLSRLAALPRVRLSDRMAYGDFIRLAGKSECVLTDGGSNQEELAYLGTPTIIMRDCTERQDGIGNNAIMEREAGNLVEYLRDGNYRGLRKERGVPFEIGPSHRIANYVKEMDKEDKWLPS
jgi:UDP-N-acetylglucosamine 2-epimerase (non-hydrolysing)